MTDTRQRLAAALADRYRLDREVGEGGMATVYLAEDLKHSRRVALKVLKPDLTAALGSARFVKEIATTAGLQHPHILPLFDSGEADGFLFYVMPFVDGETLRARLDRETQLAVDDAVRITIEVADALEYAHQHGIVHRDIKPENILLLGGHAMVADFGIALAVSAAGGTRLTETGLSLGTPEYMSPEQATAEREITARSDLFSLGSVLYEMLAGHPPHLGSTAQQIIMKVIAEPAPSILGERKSVPPHVVAALARSLEKVPADRYASAREFALALRDASVEDGGRGVRSVGSHRRSGLRQTVAQPVVLGLAGLLLASIAWNVIDSRTRSVGADAHTVRFVFTGTEDAPLSDDILGPWSAAISPDGRQLVYTAPEAPGSRSTALYLRHMDRLAASVVRGTGNGLQPLFSPDGQWLAFVSDGKLHKVRLDGSAPIPIADGAGGVGGADWATTDVIVLGATGPYHGLVSVSANGGVLTALTHPDSARGERDHFWPIAHSDGRHVVFAVMSGGIGTAELAVVSLEERRVTRLGLKGVRPLRFLDGALVYHQVDGALMAVPLDVEKGKALGPSIPVHDPVSLNSRSTGEADIHLSSGGALIAMLPPPPAQLTWLSRDGRRQPVGPERRDFIGPRLSPDQSQLAVLVGTAGRYDVWLSDLANGTLSRLTNTGNVTIVGWKPDGSGVIYADNAGTVWSQPVDRNVAPVALARSLHLVQNLDLSPDGRTLLVVVWGEQRWTIVRIDLDAPSFVRTFGSSSGWSGQPRFSPDGKWVAHVSNESGVTEVFAQSFPDGATKVQISSGGGRDPVWSADGTQLFFMADDVLQVARLQRQPRLRVASRDTVFSVPTGIAGSVEITRNGERVLAPVRPSHIDQLEVAVDWISEFRRAMAKR